MVFIYPDSKPAGIMVHAIVEPLYATNGYEF